MKALIERHWYRPRPWLGVLLAPLEALFAALSGLRRLAFRRGLGRVDALPVPVVVIGNVNVGGVGKTPLTLALLASLAERGVTAGVISRGYGGSANVPTPVARDSDPALVGDEPLLLAQAGAPVWVGRDRVAAGRALLAAHPQVQLILSDDGLQHYRLARDVEIVVLDGARGLGNGRLLPNGPLREPASRLASVDALVINGPPDAALLNKLPAAPARFSMRLAPQRFVSLAEPALTRTAADFAGLRVVALAGIGHPQRFFATLRALGLAVSREIAFPDHHAFSAADLPEDADAIVVTAKDAVKLQCVNHVKLWVLPVTGVVEPDLADWLLAKLKLPYGRKISRHSGVPGVQGPAGV
ncbi:lipid-A-disaccharide kinase [Crenobacter luteus]|uniref:Tetraacyldisaccharide 4'-kinase n=1 Tax=Crenobacter luteus TaxID=1452487 RepID=A0A163CEW7_9NEIS|nr:tetraacyldisaccharide 4'-kinase [Crenobacter luteus]KZE31701.1 tetraacyldisaccharide 4'-kinase [Crenobacter luteus]TCP15565.1 lipid-A-disaccharide kinase [Crenobacter luteus]